MNWIKSKYNDTRNAIDQRMGSDMEKEVKQVTSNENWGASSTAKAKIARATFDYQSYKEIMPLVWKRLEQKESNWRISFKALQLLDYLIKHGSDEVVRECHDRSYNIKAMKSFRFVDEDGRDRGKGVRDMSELITNLLGDREALAEARAGAKKTAQKLGVSSGGRGMGSSGGGGGGGYGGYSGGGGSSYSGYGNDSGGFGQKWGAADDAAAAKKEETKKSKKKKKKKKKKQSSSSEEEQSSSSESEEVAKKKKKKTKKKKKKGAATSPMAFTAPVTQAAPVALAPPPSQPQTQAPVAAASFDDFGGGASGGGFDDFSNFTTPATSSAPAPQQTAPSGGGWDAFAAPAAPANGGGLADFGSFAPKAAPPVQTTGFEAFGPPATSAAAAGSFADFGSFAPAAQPAPARRTGFQDPFSTGGSTPAAATASVSPQKISFRKASKPKASGGAFGGLVDLDNLQVRKTKYVAYDPNQRTSPKKVLPSLTLAAKGNISMTGFNAPPPKRGPGRGMYPPRGGYMGTGPSRGGYMGSQPAFPGRGGGYMGQPQGGFGAPQGQFGQPQAGRGGAWGF